MAEIQVRKVDKVHYKDYSNRAGQLMNAAVRARDNQEWDACAINAVQSAISASDALCTLKLGQRIIGQSHNEAVKLFKTIDAQDAGIQDNANRLARILALKNQSAYEEKPARQKDAEYLLMESQRFLDYVTSKLPQQAN